MSPHLPWLRLHRSRAPGRRRSAPAAGIVPAVIALSLLAGAVQVVDFAVSGPPRHVQLSQAAPTLSDEDAGADVEAGTIATSYLDLPPASVDAISL